MRNAEVVQSVEQEINRSPDGGSIPAPPLHFLAISKRKATELIIEHHYLHRKCPISWSWGIEADGRILGVMTVGKPCSWSATCGVVGEKYAEMKNPESRSKDVYELNRLWVSDLFAEQHREPVRWVVYLRRLRKHSSESHSHQLHADGSRKNANGLPHVGYARLSGNRTGFMQARLLLSATLHCLGILITEVFR